MRRRIACSSCNDDLWCNICGEPADTKALMKEMFEDEVLYRIADEQETSRPGTEWHSIRLVQVYPEVKE